MLECSIQGWPIMRAIPLVMCSTELSRMVGGYRGVTEGLPRGYRGGAPLQGGRSCGRFPW
eukprot:3032330-Pyramimonas_sp.AAC.1